MNTHSAFSVAVCTTFAAFSAHASLQEVAPQLIEQHQSAVAGVEGVLSFEASIMGQTGQKEEQEVSASGILVSKDGYFITSLSSLDPSESMSGLTVETPAGPQTLEIQSELSDLRIVFQDGREIPAKAVIRDPQSDLILLAPEGEVEDDFSWDFISLNAEVQEPQLLEDLLLLGRLDSSLDRSISAKVVAVESVVERPRVAYIADSLEAGHVALNSQGEIIGLCTQKISNQISTNIEAIVLIQPVEELLRLLEQAADVDVVAEEVTEEVAEAALDSVEE